MPRTSSNQALHTAKTTKQDEFYTQLSDIEKELRHYTKHFENKTVLCNCDDPKVSNFFHYFSHNFERLKLTRAPMAFSRRNLVSPEAFSRFGIGSATDSRFYGNSAARATCAGHMQKPFVQYVCVCS